MSDDDEDYSLHGDRTEKSADPRRFTIYLKINDNDPIPFKDLNFLRYKKLKYNDKFVEEFCKRNLLRNKETITNLFRSLDDVDYTRVKLKDDKNTEECENISVHKNCDGSSSSANIQINEG